METKTDLIRQLTPFFVLRTEFAGMDRALFYAYDASGDIDISAGWTDITLDTEVEESAEFIHATDSAEIEIDDDGTYEVTYYITTYVSSGSSASESRAKMQLDTGGGYADIAGTLSSMYNQDSSQGETNASVTFLKDLNDGDKIKLVAQRESGTNTIKTLANGCGVVIRDALASGARGPAGVGAGAPTDAQYVVLTGDASLSDERVLTAGDAIDITDGGAGSAVTVAVDVTDILGSGLTETANDVDLDWGTPTISTIECDDAASAGSSTNPTRSDHEHAIVCAAPIANLSVSTTNAEGSAASFARSDQSHAITSSSNPGAAASLLASDASGYLQLVGLGIGAAPASADLHFATAVGITHADGVTDGMFLRANGTRYIPATLDVADLTDLAYAVPALAFNTSNVEGSADTVMRTDATLAIFDATVPTTIAVGDTAATGSAGVTARRDHGHGITSSSNPGAAASLLASDANGYLQLVRLGLGTAPTYMLDIYGAASHLRVQSSATPTNYVVVRSDSAESFIQMYDGDTEVIRLRTAGLSWLNGGNVGVGTVSPQSVLYAKAGEDSNSILWGLTVANEHYVENWTGGGVGLKLKLYRNDPDERWAGIASVAEATYCNQVGLAFYTLNGGPTERVRIDGNGNVGIGTATPGAKLHVINTDAADYELIARFQGAAGNGLYFYGDAFDDNTNITLIQSTNGLLIDGANAFSQLFLKSDGKVGLRTTVPARDLAIGKADSTEAMMAFQNLTTGYGAGDGLLIGIDDDEEAFIWQYETNSITLGTDNVPRIEIASDGNTFIGDCFGSPDRPLHVQVNDAITATVTYAMRLSHITSGTAAAGFGIGIEFELEDDGGGVDVAATVEAIWTDASAGAEESALIFMTADIGDDGLAERVRIDHDGNVIVQDGIYVGCDSSYPKIVFDDTGSDLELIVAGGGIVLDGHLSGPQVIGGHSGNTAGSYGGTICGGGYTGHNNHVTNQWSFVGGGYDNTAGGAGTDSHCVVSGGRANAAEDYYSTISGGYGNAASGLASTVPGGHSNDAAGDYSLAAGRRAHTGANNGVFVFADSTDADFTADRADQAKWRLGGGAKWVINDSWSMELYDDGSDVIVVTNGVTTPHLTVGGAWTNHSTRASKENFKPIWENILDRVAGVPVTLWNYKAEPGTLRCGPVSEDFYGVLGIGLPTGISGTDLAGVALAAVQALYRRVQVLEKQLQS